MFDFPTAYENMMFGHQKIHQMKKIYLLIRIGLPSMKCSAQGGGSGVLKTSYVLGRALLPQKTVGHSAYSILTLKNHESFHFGFFADRLCRKELIQTMNRLIFNIGDI